MSRQEAVVTRILRPVCGPDHIVAQRGESGFRASPDAGVQEKLHLTARRDQRLDSLVRDESMGVSETGLDVLPFEPRITGENRLRRVSGGQHAENVLDGQSP
jgi:hypothetical protein